MSLWKRTVTVNDDAVTEDVSLTLKQSLIRCGLGITSHP